MLKTPLTRSELASAYCISTRTLYNWLKALGITNKYGRLTIPDCEMLFNKHGKPAGVWEAVRR